MKKLIAALIIIVTVIFCLPATACAKSQDKLSKYTINVSYDENAARLTGTVNFTFYNDTDNEIKDLKFNLWGNAYRRGADYAPVSEAYSQKAYYAGTSYGDMQVSAVENCAAWNVGGDDENILCVTLQKSVYPEETAKIAITYTLNLAKVNHRTGMTANTVNLGNFYPILCAYTAQGFAETPYYSCGDPFVSVCADYDVTLNLSSSLTAAASGQLVSESVADGRKILNYKLSCARDFAFVLSDKFEVATADAGGVKINYYYYNDASAQNSLDAAVKSVKYFSSQFGNYAYPTLSVVQTGFCMGGMEYPALTMISDAIDEAANIYTIVHENAHQWWYAMVGSDQVNCSWQDEGLAEYSSLMFFENNPEYGLTRTGIVEAALKTYRAFFTVYNQIFGEADTSMNRNLSKFISDYEYANVAYNKGIILFDTVRKTVGDEKFAKALKGYFADNKFKTASYEALFACFMKYGDVEGIFNSFVNGKVII